MERLSVRVASRFILPAPDERNLLPRLLADGLGAGQPEQDRCPDCHPDGRSMVAGLPLPSGRESQALGLLRIGLSWGNPFLGR